MSLEIKSFPFRRPVGNGADFREKFEIAVGQAVIAEAGEPAAAALGKIIGDDDVAGGRFPARRGGNPRADDARQDENRKQSEKKIGVVSLC